MDTRSQNTWNRGKILSSLVQNICSELCSYSPVILVPGNYVFYVCDQLFNDLEFKELVIRVSQAWFLGYIIQYFGQRSRVSSDPRISDDWAMWSAIGFVACSAVYGTSNHFIITLTDRVGIQMKVACSTLIYNKVSLEPSGLQFLYVKTADVAIE